MGAPSSIADLMAIATIRRLLLELGHPLQPERHGTLVGPVELWMHEPRPTRQFEIEIDVLVRTSRNNRSRSKSFKPKLRWARSPDRT
jgi:hypothetical protein